MELFAAEAVVFQGNIFDLSLWVVEESGVTEVGKIKFLQSPLLNPDMM